MGGPGASVLLREPLTAQQRAGLDSWIQSITRLQYEDTSSVYQFWIKEDIFPEPVSRCLFYFSIEDPTDLAEQETQQQVIAHLGYLPRQAIGMSSGCNDSSDHRTLGHLMLHLAETYDGLIDMQGAIVPPPPLPPTPLSKDFFKEQQAKASQRGAFLQARFKEIEATLPPGTTMPDLLRQRHSDPYSPLIALEAEMHEKFGPILPARSEPSLEDISAYIHSMPGNVYEIYYETGRKTRWVYHIVDTTFLRAWLTHPRFQMIK
jgi:hypothetical protein